MENNLQIKREELQHRVIELENSILAKANFKSDMEYFILKDNETGNLRFVLDQNEVVGNETVFLSFMKTGTTAIPAIVMNFFDNNQQITSQEKYNHLSQLKARAIANANAENDHDGLHLPVDIDNFNIFSFMFERSAKILIDATVTYTYSEMGGEAEFLDYKTYLDLLTPIEQFISQDRDNIARLVSGAERMAAAEIIAAAEAGEERLILENIQGQIIRFRMENTDENIEEIIDGIADNVLVGIINGRRISENSLSRILEIRGNEILHKRSVDENKAELWGACSPTAPCGSAAVCRLQSKCKE